MPKYEFIFCCFIFWGWGVFLILSQLKCNKTFKHIPKLAFCVQLFSLWTLVSEGFYLEGKSDSMGVWIILLLISLSAWIYMLVSWIIYVNQKKKMIVPEKTTRT